ncbi:MAG: DNA mismatch repair protein MutS [Pseudomonadota bacterium]
MNSVNANVTPMMAQYLELRKEHPDALLFFRMGDFYELFFEDAVQAAAALDIALTKRGKHLGEDIAMCGVPVHAAEGYLLTLIRKGFRVAVCEQLEDPSEAKKRGAKSVVKRGVVRMITPGTLTEDSLLQARQDNFLAAFSQVRDKAALAWTDMSSGALHVSECSLAELSPLLARLAPKEMLISQSAENTIEDLILEAGCSVTRLAPASFDSASAERRLCDLYKIQSLDAFGGFHRAEKGALGAIVEYLSLTQKGNLPFLRRPEKETALKSVQIDAATRRNLELTETLSGDKQGSLLSVIDYTITGAGARLLVNRLTNPVRDISILKDRLDAVEALASYADLRQDLRGNLKNIPDLARALSRVSLDRAGPRDLGAIRTSLATALLIHKTCESQVLPKEIDSAIHACIGHDDLIGVLDAALVSEPPLLARDGGYVAAGYIPELDNLRNLRNDSRSIIASLQAEYSEQCDIGSLKIKHNNVLGYFIETPASYASKMMATPLADIFIHRQTTANAVRFTTVVLSELETKILNAGAQALILEKQVFDQLTAAILETAAEIHATSQAIAVLDTSCALAELASKKSWSRPILTTDQRFAIVGGSHPVVEAALKKDGGNFVVNDTDLSPQSGSSLWLLTGPNMAGKSTFLRQNALIALLAQIGSFVPASKAEIGVVSQIFSRVGASDDLARGRSTFMVEMVETAAILNQADENALVILDEIGRGTATYDGLSIAWATVEHLHEVNKCRTLFATHYHELTALHEPLERVMNATVKVKEWDGEIIFLHEVTKGAADRSYGVQVAKLAGLPLAVTERAQEVLTKLEADNLAGHSGISAEDLPLFSAQPKNYVTPKKSKTDEILETVSPDEITPQEALNLIYELKSSES